MTTRGVEMNGSVMGVAMGYLDFAPEPPAPTAVPVTEHGDMNGAAGHETREIASTNAATVAIPSNGGGDVRIKFETLQPHETQEAITLYNPVGHQMHLPGHHQIQHQQIIYLPPPQHQQHVVLIDQHSQQHLHSPVSYASGLTGHLNPDGLVTIAPSNGNGAPLEMGTQIIVKQEVISEEDHHQQHQIQVEQDQSSMQSMAEPSEGSGAMSQSYQSDASEEIKNGTMDESSGQYSNLESPTNSNDPKTPNAPKTWTAEDMESALEALRSQNMSLTKASATYGIPSTTLWQRAHRLGIDTPKKEGPSKTWNEEALNNALDALRSGTISANKASKAYGIPSSTLYKIARREGIRLAAPFNAAPTSWSAEDLDRALEAIRSGQTSVQKASTEFGIPTGTLYGRCKREGIELSRTNPTPWSEDAMMEALDSVKQGHMSINQAAIHYNLPYSSLYGRFKRGKYETPTNGAQNQNNVVNHGGGGGNGGGGQVNYLTTQVAPMQGIASSPQMEFRIEPPPQHYEHNPANMQHYNPLPTMQQNYLNFSQH
ncbi:uncharacterized protein LOC6047472 [Culex quinquefasciatus]|uniref:uncharacterized protein LOC6047472 n=1 Tax=Culex quinquefasciatus TaxID=7176 RepID=UPI0018E3EC99|nr:uncharacterized protein LOC6047472 [Culex quinquefasciatus]